MLLFLYFILLCDSLLNFHAVINFIISYNISNGIGLEFKLVINICTFHSLHLLIIK